MIIKNDPIEFQNYLTDASNLKGKADKLIIAENIGELRQILTEANDKSTPIYISAAGTGTMGGRVPDSGIILSLEKLNKIISYDEVTGDVVAEAGVVLKDLLEYLEQRGRYIYGIPTEHNCFIGGNAATDASGSKAFKYGSIRSWIRSIEVITVKGEILKLSRQSLTQGFFHAKADTGAEYSFRIPAYNMPATKNSAGYFFDKSASEADLFIGSEGTLGVISKVTFRTEALISDLLGGIAFFSNDDDLFGFVNELRAASRQNFENYDEISSRLIEYFDENALKILKKSHPDIPNEAKSAIWFEQELTGESSDDLLEKWYGLITKHSDLADFTLLAQTPSGHKELIELRHQIPMESNEIVSRNGFNKLGTDTAVPLEHFREYFSFLREAAQKYGIPYMNFGHIGDCHLHLNFFPRSNEEFARGKEAYSEIMYKAVSYGGSIAGEHGIGRLKKQFMSVMYGEEFIEDMRKVKQRFDPKGILGRGVLFD